MVKYTFGTDDAGRSRLESIASVFNPLAAQFIRQHLSDQPCAVAADLGCGPGFTTDMLAQATGCSRVYGLDNAPYFLQMAAAHFPAYTFIQHDLTQIPLPVQADVIYVRFVLSHLPDAVQMVNRWLTALKPGGLLFVDETDSVESKIDVFQRYFDTNAGMIAAQGANLWIGETLAAGQYESEVVASVCDRVLVANFQAATWFLPNVETVWQTDPYVQSHLSSQEYQRIAAEIARIKASEDDRQENTWNIRRIVLRREG
ncbi:MAG: class I SAM-dependent methyltransferase [Chloroflexi bacterium]|nr:class I SAM-dependent methyltransferase [Chloroflexota bacterium]